MHEPKASASRGVHGLGQPRKPGQTHPKKFKKMEWVGLGWVIGWVWFLKMKNL